MKSFFKFLALLVFLLGLIVSCGNGSTVPSDYSSDTEVPGTDTEDSSEPSDTEEVLVSYKVKHYKEKLDGEYELIETENLEGKEYSYTEAAKKEYEGFSTEFNSELDQINLISGNLVEVKIYYTRNAYTITFDSKGGDEAKSITAKYGASITPPPTPTKKFHTFEKWNPELPETITGDLSLEVVWVEKGKIDVGVTIY